MSDIYIYAHVTTSFSYPSHLEVFILTLFVFGLRNMWPMNWGFEGSVACIAPLSNIVLIS